MLIPGITYLIDIILDVSLIFHSLNILDVLNPCVIYMIVVCLYLIEIEIFMDC